MVEKPVSRLPQLGLSFCPHHTECSAVSDQKWHDPPYLPNLVSCNVFFFLFPWMKKDFRGKRFADVKEMKQEAAEALEGTNVNDFKGRFEHWKKRLDKCIASGGDYFRGD